jgi:hypothetical protein
MSIQNNKAARNALVLESAIQSVDVNIQEDQEALIAALIEPLDLNAVAASDDPMAEFTEKYLDSDGLAQDPVIRKAVAAIQSQAKGEDFSRSDIADAVVQIGEGHHTLSGLMILADWSTLVQNPDSDGILKVYGYTEVDGTTNGVILGLRQLVGGFDPELIGKAEPGTKHAYVEGSVNSGGGILKGQDYKNGIDYLRDNPDIYQRSGQVAGEVVEEVRTDIATKPMAVVAKEKSVAGKALFEAKKKVKADRKAKVKEADIDHAAVTEAAEVLDKANTAYGIKVFGETLPNFGLKLGKVSSAIRKMMKAVVMPGGYQAGDAALKRSLFNAWLDNTYTDMAAVANERKASSTGPYLHTLDKINGVLDNLGLPQVAEADAMAEFPTSTVEVLQKTYNDSLGKEIVAAYREINGDFEVNAKIINAAHGIMAVIVRDRLARAFAEAEAKTGNGAINADQRTQIMKDLHAEGWFVGHAQYGASDASESVSISRTEQQVVSDDRGGKTSIGFNEGAIRTKLHTLGAAGNMTVQDKVTSSRTTPITESVPSADVGLAGVISGVHHMDAIIQALSASRSGVEALNVFDAKIISVLEAASETQNTNESMEILMNDWSLWSATETQLKRLLEMAPEMAMSDNPEMAAFFAPYDSESETGNKFAPKYVNEDGNEVHYGNVGNFMRRLEASVTHGNEQRIALNDAHIGQAQYNIKGGTFTVPGREVTEETDPSRGSGAQRIDRSSFDAANRAKATPETVSELFYRYLERTNVTDSPAHKARLVAIMEQQVLPLLQNSMEFGLNVDSKPGTTGGEIVGNEVFIRTSAEAIRRFSTDMSDAEVLTHEFLHAVVEAGLKNNSAVLTAVRKLQETAIRSLKFTPDALVDPTDADQAEAQKRAEEIYGYVTGSLHEFIVFGLTNARVREALEQVEVDKSAAPDAPQGLVAKIMQALQDMLATLKGRLVGARPTDRTVADGLDTMLRDFDTTTQVHLARRAASVVNNKYVTAGRGFLADKVAAPITAWGKTISHKPGTALKDRSLTENLTAIAKTPARVFNSDFHTAMADGARSVTEYKQTFWAKTAREALGPDQYDAQYHVELSKINEHVESAALSLSRTIKKAVKGAFKHPITVSEDKLLADTLLRGDLKVFKVSTAELSDLVSDTLVLDTAIADTIASLKSLDTAWITGQAKNLASIMINSEAKIVGGNTNAYNIVRGVQRTRGEIGLDMSDLDAVDKLKSLYAIKEMSGNERSRLSTLIEREPAAIEIMLEADTFNHAETLRKTYAGDQSRVVAGEVITKSSNNSSTVTLRVRDRVKLEAQGYTMGKYVGGGYALFSRADVPKEAYQKGVFSMGNAHLEGTPVDLAEYAEGGPVPIPVVVGGRVVAHRIIMDKRTREENAGMRIGAIESLGNHGGRTLRLAEGDGFNSRIIKQALADYTENGTNLLGKKGDANAFIRISTRSTDRQAAEFARLMPKAMRADIRKQWGGDMYLRKNQLDLLLGYRKLSLVDLANDFLATRAPIEESQSVTLKTLEAMHVIAADKQGKYEMNLALANSARIVGDIWQASISEVKKRTVLFTPAVIIANGLSNVAVSVLFGMNPIDVAREQKEGWVALTAYLDLQKEMGDIQFDINLGRDVAANTLRRGRLQEVMESSGVHSMVQAGMFQTIVEDIDISEAGRNPLSASLQRLAPANISEAVEGKYQALPDSVKKGFDILMLSPSTEFGASVQAATAKSDFVARYAMLTHLRKQGVNEKDAMKQVMEIFVDYSPNSSRQMQYINDSGFYMYTKFLMRIQRVIMRAFRERPEALLAMEAGQQVMGDFSDVTDSSLMYGLSLSGGRSQNPLEAVSTLSEAPLFRMFGGLLDW